MHIYNAALDQLIIWLIIRLILIISFIGIVDFFVRLSINYNNSKMCYLADAASSHTMSHIHNTITNRHSKDSFCPNNSRNAKIYFRFLGSSISKNLSWSWHMGRKAQKRLLFKFRRVEFQREVLNYFYRGAIESILTGNITQWQGFCITQDIKTALQRVIKSHTLSCEVYPAEQNVSLVFATGLIFCSDPKSSPFCQGKLPG